jgi:stage II sporulation protein AA (anti-sigma F factor antagonist)
MRIDSEKDGARATITPSGLIDTRASQEFEQHVVGLFNDGVRSVIVDLSKVDLITSAGIRVLVMMGQRLQRSGGGLVLCALSETVRGVFDVAGLLNQFPIAATRDEAAKQLAASSTPAAAPSGSKLTRLLCRLLEEGDAPAAGAAPDGRSRLAAEIVDLFERTHASSGDDPAAPSA